MTFATPFLLRSVVIAAGLAASASLSRADEAKTYELTIKDAAFQPAEIRVPKDTPFTIKLKNGNAAPVELEAKELKIEKVAAGNSEIVVNVKGMAAGKYLFVDEFQEDVAKGYIIVE